MSVWCSFGIFEEDEDQSAPIRYQRSHVLPAQTDTRGGYLDLAYIPGFVTRDGRDDGPGDERVWPYLRICVADAEFEAVAVVLDAAQVAYLRDQFTWWLDKAGEV